MQEVLPREAPESARGQGPDVLPRLRLSPASLPLPAALLLAAVSGGLLSLAHPPAEVGPLAFVAMIPLIWLVRQARPRRAFLVGLAFGIAYFAALLYWVRLFGELAWGALSVASAAFPALFALLAPLIWRERHPVRSSVGLAALWTATEYVRGAWPLGGFTWGGLAYTQSDNPYLLPLASVAGAWGVTFVVAMVNALLLHAMETAGRRRLVALGIAGITIAAALAPALIPIEDPQGRPLDVAVVQGNDLEGRALDPLVEDQLIAEKHARLTRSLAVNPPDLAVWPENALDRDPMRDPRLGAMVREAVRTVGAPMLVGAITGAPGGEQYNESLLFDGRGRLVDRYAKVHLVPFGEYVPWRSALESLSAVQQIRSDLTPGSAGHPMSVGGLRFAAVICFENSFPSLDRGLVAQGADFLVVSTNNASYLRTAASRQHLIMSRFRAVENGRWVVHAAISGISAFIDPSGTVYEQTELFEATLARRTIALSDATTLYNRLGDWVPLLSLLGVLVLLILPRRPEGAPRRTEELRELPRTLVLVPTYNERGSMEELLVRLLRLPERLDVLVVDDASPDGTAQVVRRIASSEQRVRLLERPHKAGLASAYVTGFRRAIEEGYGLVVEMDADLSHQPEDLPRLLEAARRHDLVIGSRYVAGGSVTDWGLLRRALSSAGNGYARLALGIPVSDSTSGFRVFRASLLRFLLAEGVRADGYGFQIELAYRAWRSGFSIKEVPITFRERGQGDSKISRRIIFEALWLVTRWGVQGRLPPRAPTRSSSSDVPAPAPRDPLPLSR